jgi:hypothetical protein
VGQVGEEPAVSLDHLPEADRLLHRQIVLGTAPGARQVDVFDLVRSVILGASLQVGVPHHPDLLQEGQGPVHRGRVHRGEAAVNPPGHVLRRDVPVGPEHLVHDGLPLGGDPVASLPQHGHHGGGTIHASRVPVAPALQMPRREGRRPVVSN